MANKHGIESGNTICRLPAVKAGAHRVVSETLMERMHSCKAHLTGWSLAGCLLFPGASLQADGWASTPGYDRWLALFGDSLSLPISEEYRIQTDDGGFAVSAWGSRGSVSGETSSQEPLLRLSHVIHQQESPGGELAEGSEAPAAQVVTRLLTTQLPGEIQDLLALAFGDQEPLLMTSLFEDSGASVHEMSVPAAQLDVDEGLSGERVLLSFDGLTSTLERGTDGSVLGDADLGSFSLSEAGGSFLRFDGFKVDYSADGSASPGDDSLDQLGPDWRFQRLDIDMPGLLSVRGAGGIGALPVSLRNVHLLAETSPDRDGDGMNVKLQTRADRIDVPMFPVKSVKLDFQAKQLSLDWLDNIYALPSPWVPGQLLQADSQFDFSIKTTSHAGSIAFAAESSLKPDVTSLLNRSDATLRELLAEVEFTASFDADMAAVYQFSVRELIASPQFKRLVKQDGLRYVSRIELRDLVLYINELPLSLELLMADELDQTVASLFTGSDGRTTEFNEQDRSHRNDRPPGSLDDDGDGIDTAPAPDHASDRSI